MSAVLPIKIEQQRRCDKMGIDIYIEGKNSKGKNQKVTIPIIPESIAFSQEARFAEYEILNFGQVFKPSGKNLADLSWESFFPGDARRGMKIVRGSVWTKASTLDDLMKYWLSKGTELNVRIAGTKINIDAFISEYSSEIKYLGDYFYTIGFKECEKITVSTTKRKADTKKKVTVKKGDTLQSLAKKYLGDKKKYKQLYKANKKLIDDRNKKERKKHPKKKISKYTIYKGQVLTIPSSSATTIQNDRVLALKTAINKDGYAKLTLNKKLDSATKAAMKKITIRTGRKGQVVKFVQKMVGVKQDGVCGVKTVAAIKTYQRTKGLTVDGVAGYKTLLKMIA